MDVLSEHKKDNEWFICITTSYSKIEGYFICQNLSSFKENWSILFTDRVSDVNNPEKKYFCKKLVSKLLCIL